MVYIRVHRRVLYNYKISRFCGEKNENFRSSMSAALLHGGQRPEGHTLEFPVQTEREEQTCGVLSKPVSNIPGIRW